MAQIADCTRLAADACGCRRRCYALAAVCTLAARRSVRIVLNSELLAVCTRIRRAVEEFMDERDVVGLGWDEESVTNVSIHRGLPEVRVQRGCRGTTQGQGRTDLPRRAAGRRPLPGPYFEHLLRGLRAAPPSYVIDALKGREVPLRSEFADRRSGSYSRLVRFRCLR